MRNIWLLSDTHFNHTNFLKFVDEDGKRIRPFDNIQQMNELIMDNWADTVKPGDSVYHLGDVYFGDGLEASKLLRKLPGRKRLIVGNHDDIKEIVKYEMFQKIQMWRVFAEEGLILSHIPLHPSSLHIMRIQSVLMNVHGHIHQNQSPDGGYYNVSMEAINYKPVNMEEIIHG